MVAIAGFRHRVNHSAEVFMFHAGLFLSCEVVLDAEQG